MQPVTARDQLLDRILSLDNEQFEQLCKMLIERAEQTRDLELTPFRGDGGIDVHAIVDRDLFHASLGVQAKQYQPGNSVGVNTLRSFKGALTDQNYHIGTVITTSSFTDGAEESAETDSIRLIDGDRLLDIMMGSEIGVIEASDDEYELDSEFWDAFEQPEETDVIPSLEVPQADNFDVVRLVLQSVDTGLDMKHDITGYLESATGEEWDPRQADYYGIAGWLLGFLHKEQRVKVDGRPVRRWGLTRGGEEYVELVDRGDDQRARDRLYEAIRDVEIVARIYEQLEQADVLERQQISEIIEVETELSGTTAPRRARTVGQWLAALPEVKTSGSGSTEEYRLVSENLDDF
jgi:restriction system protein